jgi:hypothetical protein
MSIQFPFHSKTDSTSPINPHFSVPSHLSISKKLSCFYERSSIVSLSSHSISDTCKRLSDLINRCFSSIFSKFRSYFTSLMTRVPSTTSTIAPTFPVASTSAEAATSSVDAATSSAEATSSTGAAALQGATLQGRIALAKNVIVEHLSKDDYIRQATFNQALEGQSGIMIVLRYNRYETVIRKNWADANRREFLLNRVEAFLSDATNRDHSQGILEIQTICIQKKEDRGNVNINWDRSNSRILIPQGTTESARESRVNTPQMEFNHSILTITNPQNKRAARDFINNLAAWRNSDEG